MRFPFLSWLLWLWAIPAFAATSYRFDFGSGPVAVGRLQVTAGLAYNKERGYGFDFALPVDCFDRGPGEDLTRDGCTGNPYLYFSVSLPEGNYRLIATTGDAGTASSTTVKAESRRLLLANSDLPANRFRADTFSVNRRNVAISSGGSVQVTDRELGGLNWDGDKLTLEFSGTHPSVVALDIEPASQVRQLFLCGNSTVCDWATETEAAWGQMLSGFLKSSAVVVNMAEAGLTTSAFLSQKRLDKIASLAQAGDYVFMEFGHNDQKALSLAQFKANLGTFVSKAKALKAIPVLISPTPRHSFSGGKVTQNYLNPQGEDLLAGVRQYAKDENVILLDLNACGTTILETLGSTQALKLYWKDQGTQDHTHFNDYGAYAMASCVAEQIRVSVPDLAAHLRADFRGFDAKQPDSPDAWRLPLSADTSVWHTPAKATALMPKPGRRGKESPGHRDATRRGKRSLPKLIPLDGRELGAKKND